MLASDLRATVAERVREINALVVDGDLDTAREQLLALAEAYAPDKASKRDATLLSLRYRKNQREIHLGRANRDTDAEHSAIAEAFLFYTEELVERIDASQNAVAVPPAESPPQTETASAGVTQDAVFAKQLQKVFARTLGSFTLGPVDCALAPGKILGVAGTNGSGKSTFLRMLAGDLSVDRGQLEYPALWQGKVQWHAVKPRIAYVPQRPSEWKGDLETHLALSAALSGIRGEANEEEVELVLGALGLTAYREEPWHRLSGGIQMRCALAAARVSRPRLLVLDEPLAPLDVRAQSVFLRNLADLAKSPTERIAIVVSSQHIPEVESIADAMVLLRDGQVVFSGPTRTIGTELGTNVYEIESSDGKLVGLSVDGVKVTTVGSKVILETKAGLDGRAVLDTLKERSVTLTHFRDISRSVQRYLLLDGQGGRS